MLDVKKHNFTQGINGDDDEKLLQEGEYLNLLNARVGISENGKDLRIENVLSNIERSNPYLPSGINQTIGSAVDIAKKRLFFFNWNSNAEDGVYCYDLPTSTFYKVLVNSNLIPNSTQLTTNVIIAGGGFSGISAAVEYFGYLKEGDTLSISVGKDEGSSIIDPFTVTITVGYYETFVEALQRLANIFNQNAIAITYGLNASVGSTIHADNAILIDFNGTNWICQSNITLYAFNNKPLNFSKDYRVDRNAKVIGDLLYWCEGDQNQPRKVNIEAGIKTNHPTYITDVRPYALPIDYKWIHWIKRPPIYPIVWEKKTKPTNTFTALSSIDFLNALNGMPWNGVVLYNAMTNFLTLDIGDVIEFSGTTSNNKKFTVVSISGNYIELLEPIVVESGFFTARQVNVPATNFIKDDVFYFGYYYEFWDNEVSAVSMLSEVCQMNRHTEFDNVAAFYGLPSNDDEIFNTAVCKVPFLEKISPEIKSVVFFVKYGQDGVSEKIKILNCNNVDDYNSIKKHNQGIAQLSVSYYNNVKGGTIDSVFINSPQDIIPIFNKTFDVSKNRIFSANCLFGYNSPSLSSLIANANYISYSGDGNWIKSFPYGSVYKVSITFYDEFKRKCGSVFVSSNQIKIIDCESDYTKPNWRKLCDKINWSLSNTNSLFEIPDWAHYYSIGLTKNNTFNSFSSNYVGKTGGTNNAVLYVIKNNDTYTYRTGDYYIHGVGQTTNPYAIALNIQEINNTISGLYGVRQPYLYSPGDYCDFVFESIPYMGTRVFYDFKGLKVIGTDGVYVLIESKDIGTLPDTMGANDQIRFYARCCKKSDFQINDIYYENGKIYQINNPTESTRNYSVLNGEIIGEAFTVSRNVIYAPNIPINFVSNNFNNQYVFSGNRGYINIIDTIGQKRLKDTIAFSDTFIPGSKVNGLNKFQPLNRKEVGIENGEIQKLQLTNKQQEDGKVMLVYTNNTVFSAYLGETQLVGSSKNANVAISENVIGTINALKLNSGTIDPGTVLEINGEVYSFDRINGKWVQYSTNGLYPISNYKMQRFFKEYAKLYNNTSAATIDGLNGFHHLTGCYDPYHNEIMLMMPALVDSSTLPKLPSYNNTTPSYATDIIKREDVFDKLAKTISFNNEKNRHITTYEYAVEWADYIDGKLFKFKDGKLFEHSVSNNGYNTFFGTQKPIRVVLSSGGNASEVKDLLDIAIEGNKIPNFTYAHAVYPNEQITDLIGDDYTEIEGVFYASFKKDRLSPNVNGTAVDKMLEGDIIKSIAPIIYLEFRQFENLCYVNIVNIGFEKSLGHNNILK